MNAIWIVLPILSLLMFELGLTLEAKDFLYLKKHPKAVIVGMIGQIACLPLIAFLLGRALQMDAVFFVGLMLIACSPGGSSSNVFSMIAKGDVALSVSLTALSSFITLFTLPLILDFTLRFTESQFHTDLHLPAGKLFLQNIVLMVVPILAGIAVRKKLPRTACFCHKALSKAAFPLLLLLASLFFVQHRDTICNNFARLGLGVSLLIILSMGAAALLAKSFRIGQAQQRTILIEVGMQNAAQSIAIASSPFLFNNSLMAVPAIVYALMMNVILLSYVAAIAYRPAWMGRKKN